MSDLSAAFAFLQVVLIDVSLSGDNAIIIGMAAAGLPRPQRRKGIAIGIGAAIALRVVFAVLIVYLLDVPGLVLVGGLMLAWVCWKMWSELRANHHAATHLAAPQTKTLLQAIVQITVADVSMSLDNVLAVAGAAKGEVWVLAIGLTVAVGFMALLSAYIAKLLARYHWITWIGLAIVLYVAMEMVWTGTHQVGCQFVSTAVCDSGALRTLSTLLS